MTTAAPSLAARWAAVLDCALVTIDRFDRVTREIRFDLPVVAAALRKRIAEANIAEHLSRATLDVAARGDERTLAQVGHPLAAIERGREAAADALLTLLTDLPRLDLGLAHGIRRDLDLLGDLLALATGVTVRQRPAYVEPVMAA